MNKEKIQMNWRISGITLYVLMYVLVAGSMYEALKMVFMCTNERRKVCKGNRIEKGAAVQCSVVVTQKLHDSAESIWKNLWPTQSKL